MYEMGKPCLQRLGQLEVIGYDIINTVPILKNQKWVKDKQSFIAYCFDTKNKSNSPLTEKNSPKL